MSLVRMQQRRDTAANWASANPVLASGELGYDTDNKALRIGDGSSAWAALQSLNTQGAVYNVCNYGAVGDGTTDDATAFAAALAAISTAGAGTLLIPGARTYKLGTELAIPANCTVWGYGATLTTTTTRRRSFLYVATNNVRILGLSFTLGKSVLVTYQESDYTSPVYTGGGFQVGVYAEGATNVFVRDCRFTDLYVFSIFVYNCSQTFEVESCYFTSPAQAHMSMNQHIEIHTSSVHMRIVRCDFDNAAPIDSDHGNVAVFISNNTTNTVNGNGSIVTEHCRFNYCGRSSGGGHQLGAWSCYGDVSNISVRDNVFYNTLERGIRLTACWDVEVCRNYIAYSSMAPLTTSGIAVEGTTTYYPASTYALGCYRVWIEDNVVIDDQQAQRVGIQCDAWDYGTPLRGLWILSNQLVHCKYAIYGSGPFDGVWIEGNRAYGNNGNAIFWLIGPNAAKPSTTVAAEATGRYANMAICRNSISATGNNNNSNAIFVDFTIAGGTTASIERIRIEHNETFAVSGGGTGIVVRGPASGFKAGEFIIANNRVQGFNTGFDAASAADVTVESNLIKTVSVAYANMTTSENTRVRTRDNRWTATAINRGTATLVNGTVEVSTGEVLAGDTVVITRLAKNASTALGVLTLGTITPGTKFVVNAHKADLSGLETNDQSAFTWEIVH